MVPHCSFCIANIKDCNKTDQSRVLYQCRQILVSILAHYTVLSPGLPHGFLSFVMPVSSKIRWEKVGRSLFFWFPGSSNSVQEQPWPFCSEETRCFWGVGRKVTKQGDIFEKSKFESQSYLKISDPPQSSGWKIFRFFCHLEIFGCGGWFLSFLTRNLVILPRSHYRSVTHQITHLELFVENPVLYFVYYRL